MPRLFIALPFENPVRDSLSSVHEYLYREKHLLKTVLPENYHITLKFLGNCSDELAMKIRDGLDELQLPVDKIPITVKGIGGFPNTNKVSVIWAGIKTGERLIENLYENIETFAGGLGFEKERRKFSPHLTLARVRKNKRISDELRHYIEKNKETEFCKSSFDRLVLFSSDLTPKGPVYTEVKSIGFYKPEYHKNSFEKQQLIPD